MFRKKNLKKRNLALDGIFMIMFDGLAASTIVVFVILKQKCIAMDK